MKTRRTRPNSRCWRTIIEAPSLCRTKSSTIQLRFDNLGLGDSEGDWGEGEVSERPPVHAPVPIQATWDVQQRRLLDDSRRTGVWPDSVQVIGGKLSMRLPTG